MNPQSEPTKKNEEKSGGLSYTIKISDLLGAKKEETRTEDIDQTRQSLTEQRLKERETERVGRQKYYKLRDKWSWFIFGFVCFMLVFQILLTVMIGAGVWGFEKNKTFLHIVIGENFAQIIGMGIIVAKFLFPNKDHH